MRGGLDRFLETGPLEPPFLILRRQLRALEAPSDADRGRGARSGATVQAGVRARPRALPDAGRPAAHEAAPLQEGGLRIGDRLAGASRSRVRATRPPSSTRYAAYRRDLNVLVSRGVWRMFRVAEAEYRRTLDAHAVLDFSDVLLHALRPAAADGGVRAEPLPARVALSPRAGRRVPGHQPRAVGAGVAADRSRGARAPASPHSGPLQPSIFIVGDRKQSIYGFRDADVSLLREASRHLEALRPDGDVRRSISRSFRSVPALLAFVNDVCHDIDKAPARRDAFRYEEEDRFPIDETSG